MKRVVEAFAAEIKEELKLDSVVKSAMKVFTELNNHDSKALPNEGGIHPAYTVGDVRAVGAFWQVDWLVADLLGAMLARWSRQICRVDVLDLVDSAEEVAILAHASDDVQREATPVLMEVMAKQFEARPLNEDAVRELQERIFGEGGALAALAQRLINSLEAQAAAEETNEQLTKTFDAAKSVVVPGSKTLQ